jgi:hypothetical protein
MIITRKKYEKEIRKAEKRGAKEAYEKYSVQSNFDSIGRNMHYSLDKIHMEFDKIFARLDKLEVKEMKTK